MSDFAISQKETFQSLGEIGLPVLLKAADAEIARREDEVAKARASRDEEVTYCSTNKMQVSKDYWQRCHRAEEKLRVARDFRQALADVMAEG